jgi:uncharacterized protein (DUF924 family)
MVKSYHWIHEPANAISAGKRDQNPLVPPSSNPKQRNDLMFTYEYMAILAATLTASSPLPAWAADHPPAENEVAIKAPAINTEAAAIIDFWRAAGPSKWFAKDPEFDRRFRERFLPLHELAARSELSSWMETPGGSLALLILLDQFPRNAFRGTPRMYATDELALRFASEAIEAGQDLRVPTDLQLFMYLPFAHSEKLADQERSVSFGALLREPNLSHAKGHYEIIRRFGRFPHRNPILNRAMKPEEQRFLDEGGFAG